MTWRAALLALTLLSCRGARPTFTCSADGQCGAGGSCITGACAFGDLACSSGLRWDVSAPGRARACVAAADAGAPTDYMAPEQVDLAAVIDSAGGADIAPAGPDMVVVVHFYPTLQAQIDSYNCASCHSATIPPRLYSGDTTALHRNYDELLSYAAALVADINASAHPLHIPAPDVDAWANWAAAPAL